MSMFWRIARADVGIPDMRSNNPGPGPQRGLECVVGSRAQRKTVGQNTDPVWAGFGMDSKQNEFLFCFLI
jgi:hypothetical protein